MLWCCIWLMVAEIGPLSRLHRSPRRFPFWVINEFRSITTHTTFPPREAITKGGVPPTQIVVTLLCSEGLSRQYVDPAPPELYKVEGIAGPINPRQFLHHQRPTPYCKAKPYLSPIAVLRPYSQLYFFRVGFDDSGT